MQNNVIDLVTKELMTRHKLFPQDAKLKKEKQKNAEAAGDVKKGNNCILSIAIVQG